MDRRAFLRSSCRACAALAIAPAVITLDGCASSMKMLPVENGVLTVPMDALGNSSTAVVSGHGLANKLLIVKHADGSYSALEFICPHKGGPLKETAGSIECNWHHSRFDLHGKVLNGPARTDLKSYPVEAEGAVLKVRVA